MTHILKTRNADPGMRCSFIVTPFGLSVIKSKPGRPRRSGKLSALAAVLLFSVGLTGCVNLKAVHDFAATSADGQTMQTAAAQLADSPQRQIQYVQDTNAIKSLEMSAAIGKTNQQAVLAAFGVIQKYMTTLATLAGDGIVASNNAVAGLSQQLVASDLFGTDTNAPDAYGKLAGLVFKAATDFYRQAQLREMIERAAPCFPVAIATLQHIVTNDCVLELRTEMDAADQYYEILSGLQNPDTPKWAVVLVEDIHQDRKAAIQNKINICQQYGIVLGKIADGHAVMVKNLHHLGAKELASALNGYQQQIAAVYEGLKKIK